MKFGGMIMISVTKSSTYTEIYGNKKIIVDGCSGITDYDDKEISIKSGKMDIIIKGNALKLKVLNDSAAVIEGYISSVNFSYF